MSDSPEPVAPPEAPETTSGDEMPEQAAELERLRAEAKKWEGRAKANSGAVKELEQLRQASMSDLEKAVAIARQEARSEALREVGSGLVDDLIRTASEGRPVDPDTLLEGLDRTRFLDDEGRPDTKAIRAWLDRLAPRPEEGVTRFPDLGQGSRVPPHALNGDPLLADLKNALGIS